MRAPERRGAPAPDLNLLLLLAPVEGDCGVDQRLERVRIDRLIFPQIDGAAHIAVEAGVEQARRVRQRRALREGQLDHRLVAFAGAEDAVMRPDRNAAPFPFLDHIGIGFPDQRANMGERFAAPVAEFRNALVDQCGGNGSVVHRAVLSPAAQGDFISREERFRAISRRSEPIAGQDIAGNKGSGAAKENGVAMVPGGACLPAPPLRCPLGTTRGDGQPRSGGLRPAPHRIRLCVKFYSIAIFSRIARS